MKGPILAALGLAAAAGLGGCSSGPAFNPQQLAMMAAEKQHEAQVQAAKDVVDQTPPWYAAPPADAAYIYGAGTATSGDMQFAIDKAALNAKRALADQVRGKLSADLKDYLEESGSSAQPVSAVRGERVVHDVVADVDLQGYEVTQRKVVAAGIGYRAFVLIRYPVSAAAHQVVADVKFDHDSSIGLRATKAFSDLEKEIHDAKAHDHAAEGDEPPQPVAAPRPSVEIAPEN